MAIDNRLQIFDEQGNPVDYDILASDVKFLSDGKDLPTKLAEMEQEIEDAGQGDGTVTGVKVGSTPYNPDSNGVVDLSTPFNGKVDKDPNKELIPSTDLAKLQNLPTADELTQQMGAKANDADVVKGIRAYGSSTNLPKQDGIVTLPKSQGGLTKEDISVETQGDGTVDINVGSDTYTINLNHTHENMAKLRIVDEEPSDPARDTIYALVDNVTSPGEILSLWIAGLEFVGGGGSPDDGTPRLLLPNTDINLGENQGSGLTKTIPVRAKNLDYGGSTTGLTIDVEGTGLTMSYGQQTGLTTLTIPQVNGIVNTEIGLVFSGTAALDDGKLTFSQGASELSSVDVVASVYNPYVTNGLVFHLDGADATTTEWVDRVGNIAFAMNNVTLDNNGGVVFNGTNSYGRYATASSLGFKPHTHTIEVVADIGGTATALLFMQNNESDLAFGISGSNNVIACAQTNINDKTYQRGTTNQSRGLMTFSFANMTAYRDAVGTALTVEANGCFDPTANAGVFIGARDTTRSFLQGTIYQIRVYNRLLTAEEILANQQVDINRYNIQ